MGEAPVKRHRASVGLDVHARSVVACALDGETGEGFERRLTPDHQEILEWIRTLPGPARVVCEAGPTGFGLARFLLAAGIVCLVAAPSKIQHPSGDRVKTDTRDARHLARLLHLGEVVDVAIPSAEQEAARDLVRARDDCRGDLVCAQHRLTKMLLRQRIIHSGGSTWTRLHDVWLRSQKFTTPGLQIAYDTAYETVIATTERQARLDTAIAAMATASSFTPVVTRLGCLRGVSTLTAFGLATEIGDWHRLTGRSIGAYLGPVPTEYSSGTSRSQGGITKTAGTRGGCGGKRRGITADRIGPVVSCAAGGRPRPRRPRRADTRRIIGCTPGGNSSTTAGNHRWWRTRRSHVSSPAGAGPWPSSTGRGPAPQ